MKQVVLQDVGPISHLSINVPPDGGVVVLKGRCGSGKTHAITAVNALASDDARKKLVPRDGKSFGVIEGLGVKIRLSRRTTQTGELECDALETGVDPSVLVDPGIKDPDAADARRLQAVIKLAGIAISRERWAAAVGSHSDSIPMNELISDDPVATADKLRRALHSVALGKEKKGESFLAEAGALKKSISDVDMSASSDHSVLQQQYDSAYQELANLKAKKSARDEAERSRKDAAKSIEAINAQSTVDIVAIEAEIESLSNKQVSLQDEIGDLEVLLKAKKSELSKVSESLDSNRKSIAAERVRVEKIESLRLQVMKAIPEEISSELIESLKQKVEKCGDQIKNGEVVRRAKDTFAKAEAKEVAGNAEMDAAESIRSIARSMDAVLESALVDAGFDLVRVSNGRICVQTDRGVEPISELSTGERWTVAFDIAAKGLGEGGMMSIGQEGWQSLDPDHRNMVADLAKTRKLLVWAAQVDDGDLRAESF